MPQGPRRVRRRSERVAYERDSRANHCDYSESPAKLLKAYEAGLERTRLRLEQQREEISERPRYGAQRATPETDVHLSPGRQELGALVPRIVDQGAASGIGCNRSIYIIAMNGRVLRNKYALCSQPIPSCFCDRQRTG